MSISEHGEPMSTETSTPADEGPDRAAIRELLENWVVWRDAGDWDRFATLWHDDGHMVATWCQTGFADFIAACRRSFDAGTTALHLLGGSSIELNGVRAVSQTKMQILVQGLLDGVAVNSTCVGRFVDALEKRDGRWGLVLRHPVYELDWLAPVAPSVTLHLDPDLLGSFPTGYRHIAYLQTKMGLTVNRNLPCTRGPEVEALQARMRRWLAGGPVAALS